MTVATVTAPNGRSVRTELDASFETVYKWCSEHYKFDSGNWLSDNLSQFHRLQNLQQTERTN